MTASNHPLNIGYHAGKSVHNNVISYLQEHLVQFPERTALSWADPQALSAWNGDYSHKLPHQTITFSDFAGIISRTAKGLHNMGIHEGDRVIIFLPMGVGMYAAMFSVQKIGAIAVFLDSWARASHLGASAECVGPKAMISHQAAFNLVKAVPEFSTMKYRILAGPGPREEYDATLETLMRTPGESEIAPVASETTALITFTTGSSGKPKGANRTHRFLSAQHIALDKVIPYAGKDKDLPAFPIFSLNNLAAGVTTVLPALDLARPSEKDSALLACQILHENISCATLSPSMFNNLSAFCLQNHFTLQNLRRVVTGGAPVSRDNVYDFSQIAPNAEIWILYGSTEVEPMAHIEAKEMLKSLHGSDREVIEEGVNVGHISPDLEYKFIRISKDPIDAKKTGLSHLEVPKGEIGEFIVTGDHVCRDYYNNEEAFIRAKIVDQDGKIWHRTGDLAYEDPNHCLWVVGRIHNVIIRMGKYYFPVRAEVILKRFPFVKQAAFLGMPDGTLGEKTAAALVLNDPNADKKKCTSEVQRVFVKNNIPVDCVFFMDSIPMDPRHHSKVEYHVLRDQILKKEVPNALRK